MQHKNNHIDRREFLETGLQAAAGASAFAGGLAASASAADRGKATDTEPQLPTTEEIFSWVEDLWRFGHEDRYGYRMPGTKSDHQGTQYIADKFRDFGLDRVHRESVPVATAFPDRWTLTVRANGTSWEIPCYFLRYAAFTGPEGVTAPMVCVGEGTEADYAKNDVRGKIVVVDIVSGGLPPAFFGAPWPDSYFTYDPQHTLANERPTENWPIKNKEAYKRAVDAGAAGFVGILELMAGDMNQYLHWYLLYELPALSVSPLDGKRLRETLKSGNAEATLVLTGEKGQGETFNVYGFLPGKRRDEIVTMMTHTDGWATNEASGTSILLGLAKYLAQFPKESRERTLMFFGIGSHFGCEANWSGHGLDYVEEQVAHEDIAKYFNFEPDWDKYRCLAYKLLERTVCANNVEMIGRQYVRKGDDFVPTEFISPRAWGVTGTIKDDKEIPNPALFSFVRDAITEHDMRRSMVTGRHVGEALRYKHEKIPTVHLISHNAWQFTYKDTPETVMKEALQPTVAAFADILRREDAAPKESLLPVDPGNGF